MVDVFKFIYIALGFEHSAINTKSAVISVDFGQIRPRPGSRFKAIWVFLAHIMRFPALIICEESESECHSQFFVSTSKIFPTFESDNADK